MQIEGEFLGGWVAGYIDNQQWIEAVLSHCFIIEGILTQGRRDEDMWIISFTLSEYFCGLIYLYKTTYRTLLTMKLNVIGVCLSLLVFHPDLVL